jgi:murein DD-endopeptidase MepM/ murein hydrolase activator NlpD
MFELLKLNQFSRAFGVCAAMLGLALTAQPASANSAAAAAAAAGDVTEPLKAEDGSTAPDKQFSKLFASWVKQDRVVQPSATVPAAVPTRPTISIPSAMPLYTGRMSSGYGMRNHPVLGRRKHHNGVDIAAPTGTPVYATADGVVGRADYSRSYGRVIYLGHGGNIETRYAHMSRLIVSKGQRVKKGQMIGYVGSTGRSTGPHLHYEVRVNGKSVNPLPYMVESKTQKRFALAQGEGGRGGR